MSFGDSPFHGEGYRNARASSAHRRRGFCGSCERTDCSPNPAGAGSWPARSRRNHHPRRSVDEMWGTDMTTTLLTIGELVPVFVIINHLSSRCVGLHAFDARHTLRCAAAHPRMGERTHRNHRRRRRRWPCPSATTTGRKSVSTAPSGTRFVGWGSTRPRPSFARPKATAASSDSSVPSRKICSGRRCTRASKTCNEPSNGSRTSTTKSGWSSATGIARPASSHATRMKPRLSRKP